MGALIIQEVIKELVGKGLGTAKVLLLAGSRYVSTQFPVVETGDSQSKKLLGKRSWQLLKSIFQQCSDTRETLYLLAVVLYVVEQGVIQYHSLGFRSRRKWSK